MSGASAGIEGLPLALLLGAVFAFFASRLTVFDGDLFWHLANARWVVEHGALLRADVFSSTAQGAPVPQHEWLSEMAMYGAYLAASWPGIAALRTVAVFVIAAGTLRHALSLSTRPSIAVLAAMPGIVLSRIDWQDRAELYGLACFVAFLPLAMSLRRGDRRALYALPPLLLLWANLHGGFAVGLGLLALLTAEAYLTERARARGLAIATIASAAACVIHPDGLAVFLNPLWHAFDKPTAIEEWRPPEIASATGALWALAAAVTVAVAVLARIPLRWLVVLGPLLVLSATASRHAPLFGLAAAPYLAEAIPAAAARLGRPLAPVSLRLPRLIAPLALAAAALAAVTAPGTLDLSIYPTAALPRLAAEPGTLLNEYAWGGYLIWSDPARPVFIDGRFRPYAGRVFDDFLVAITASSGWQEVLDRYGVKVVLIRPTWPLAAALSSSGWRTVASGDVFVLFRRDR